MHVAHRVEGDERDEDAHREEHEDGERVDVEAEIDGGRADGEPVEARGEGRFPRHGVELEAVVEDAQRDRARKADEDRGEPAALLRRALAEESDDAGGREGQRGDEPSVVEKGHDIIPARSSLGPGRSTGARGRGSRRSRAPRPPRPPRSR